MKVLSRSVFFLILSVVFFSSCRVIRPSLMMKAPRDYPYAQLTDSMSKEDYYIGVADLLKISISPNDGFDKVNLVNSNAANNNNISSGDGSLALLVGIDGKIKLPLVGLLDVRGKTPRNLEMELENLFQNYYVKPFASVQVMNRRVVVFNGNGGTGRALPLLDYNTTLFEVLGQAGGVSEDGRAYRIKLIRTYRGGITKVFKVDLSTINNVKEGNIVIMANDVIYVEPRMRFSQKFMSELAPYLSLLSTSILFYGILRKK